MTCMQVIEEAKCNLHDAIVVIQRALKNSTIVDSGGTTDISNLLN